MNQFKKREELPVKMETLEREKKNITGFLLLKLGLNHQGHPAFPRGTIVSNTHSVSLSLG
jgi:hypothetical protein